MASTWKSFSEEAFEKADPISVGGKAPKKTPSEVGGKTPLKTPEETPVAMATLMEEIQDAIETAWKAFESELGPHECEFSLKNILTLAPNLEKTARGPLGERLTLEEVFGSLLMGYFWAYYYPAGATKDSDISKELRSNEAKSWISTTMDAIWIVHHINLR